MSDKTIDRQVRKAIYFLNPLYEQKLEIFKSYIFDTIYQNELTLAEIQEELKRINIVTIEENIKRVIDGCEDVEITRGKEATYYSTSRRYTFLNMPNISENIKEKIIELTKIDMPFILDVLEGRATQKRIKNEFGNGNFKTRDIKYYVIMNALQNMFLSQEKEISDLLEKELNNMTIYLDTNVIISMLIPTDGNHQLTNYLISNLRKHNVKFKYLSITKEELGDTVKYRDDKIAFIEAHSLQDRGPLIRQIRSSLTDGYFTLQRFRDWRDFKSMFMNKFEEICREYEM